MSEEIYMPEIAFWNTIDVTLAAAEGTSVSYERQQGIQVDALLQALRYADPVEIVAFQNRMNMLFAQTDKSHLACAGYLMCGGFERAEEFDYFRYWLISRGENVYYTALRQPDDLVNLVKYQPGFRYGFVDFPDVAAVVFQGQTGCELGDYLANDEVGELEELDWDENDSSSMQRICPKIYAQYWRN